MTTFIKKFWRNGTSPAINATNLNSINYALALANEYEGAEVLITWTDGLPTQKLHKDTVGGNVIKQIDITWANGLPTVKVYTLNDYDETNTLVNSVTFTITTTWTNGLPVRKVIT
jgi:enoyl-[acyl-carrier-protein] reductase (NADH)